MKFKYLALLILFIMNISATVIADTSHVHLPKDKIETESHLQKHDHSNEDDKNPCADHVCCHAGHVHHFLLTETTFTLEISSYQSGFPRYLFSLLDIHSDLIKPPTV